MYAPCLLFFFLCVQVTFGGVNQVSPTFVNVQVRPQQPVRFRLQVQPARNFPIDLYLLMDLSHSMEDDLANLQRLASNLGMPREGRH